jgi:hypothetical protein
MKTRGRDGWTRLSAPGDKLGTRWRHDASGIEVRHCGHPTANHPYYIAMDAFPRRCVMSFNGFGWATLIVALEVAERIHSGELQVTIDNCGDATARVPTMICDGREVCS